MESNKILVSSCLYNFYDFKTIPYEIDFVTLNCPNPSIGECPDQGTASHPMQKISQHCS